MAVFVAEVMRYNSDAGACQQAVSEQWKACSLDLFVGNLRNQLWHEEVKVL